MTPEFEKTVIINSNPANVWNTLTDLKLMRKWMGETEMEIEIQTDWEINNPIIINGFHHVKFENKGVVLQFEPNRIVSYTHLNSLSRLEDRPGNYSIITFVLRPVQDQTSLILTIDNFPTETIFKHLCFYWRTTLEKIKISAEKQAELLNS